MINGYQPYQPHIAVLAYVLPGIPIAGCLLIADWLGTRWLEWYSEKSNVAIQKYLGLFHSILSMYCPYWCAEVVASWFPEMAGTGCYSEWIPYFCALIPIIFDPWTPPFLSMWVYWWHLQILGLVSYSICPFHCRNPRVCVCIYRYNYIYREPCDCDRS